VPKGPSLDRSESACRADRGPSRDHASFEGVIPAGQYGAGEVIVWDCGAYSPDEGGATWFHDRAQAEREIRDGLVKGKLSFLLRGEKLKGSFALVRTKEAKQWLMIKRKDRFAVPADITVRNHSVLSGKTVGELKFLPVNRISAAQLAPTGKVVAMPTTFSPMLAEIGDAPFNRADWMWEPKLDGYRVLAFIEETGVKLRSRKGLELAEKFPAVVAELGQQAAGSMILDGELVAFNAGGRPSFATLQDRAQLKTEREIAAADRTSPVVFGFDLLYFAGIDLRQATYADRRRYLAQCPLPPPLVQLVHAANDGIALHAAALASGFEGVIGKRRESRYEAGRRSPSWLKVKPTQSADFVIGGYTKGKGSRVPLGAILVGYWDQDKLCYASHVGSGFDEACVGASQGSARAVAPQQLPVWRAGAQRPDDLVEPETVAEVSFQSWTEDDHLRAPVFLRLRDDVDARSVRRPALGSGSRTNPTTSSQLDDILAQLTTTKPTFTLALGPHRIRLTHLDRVYWPAEPERKLPAFTKRDLLIYLAQISPYMLSHLADRPLTMIRMPEDTRPAFFQKHWDQERPDFVDTITVFSATRTRVTNTSSATTSLRCCGSANPARSIPRPGIRARSRERTRYRRAPTTRPRSSRWRLRCSTIRLRAVRHRSLYLFRQGSARRGTGTEHDCLREGQGSGVLAA
jgi:bifunctional non-homologous end joining protein LigD